jgi:hypothetical protein
MRLFSRNAYDFRRGWMPVNCVARCYFANLLGGLVAQHCTSAQYASKHTVGWIGTKSRLVKVEEFALIRQRSLVQRPDYGSGGVKDVCIPFLTTVPVPPAAHFRVLQVPFTRTDAHRWLLSALRIRRNGAHAVSPCRLAGLPNTCCCISIYFGAPPK